MPVISLLLYLAQNNKNILSFLKIISGFLNFTGLLNVQFVENDDDDTIISNTSTGLSILRPRCFPFSGTLAYGLASQNELKFLNRNEQKWNICTVHGAP